jgi:hypothetical protein
MKRLEMQIPQENTYIGLTVDDTNDNNFEDFLDNNYEFPSGNANEIKEYIVEDSNLKRIICDLPKIISKEFSQSPINLDFMKYTPEDEVILQISIKTRYNGETSSAKKDIIIQELFNNYESPEKYYFITMEF